MYKHFNWLFLGLLDAMTVLICLFFYKRKPNHCAVSMIVLPPEIHNPTITWLYRQPIVLQFKHRVVLFFSSQHPPIRFKANFALNSFVTH